MEVQELLLWLLLGQPPVCGEGLSEGCGRVGPSLFPHLHPLPPLYGRQRNLLGWELMAPRTETGTAPGERTGMGSPPQGSEWRD